MYEIDLFRVWLDASDKIGMAPGKEKHRKNEDCIVLVGSPSLTWTWL